MIDPYLTRPHRVLDHAWSLVTEGIEYTAEEIAQLDPKMQHITRLANALRVWRAGLPVSEEARRFQQEIEVKNRRRRQAWHEAERWRKECLLHPERIPEEVREVILWLLNVDVRMSLIARKPRPNALQKLIQDILKNHSPITDEAVLWELSKRQGQGVILSVFADTVEWIGKGGKVNTTSVEAIGHRVYRAKKNYPR